MTNLTDLYEFRALNGNVTAPRINRFQAVSQLLSWYNQNIDRKQLRVERLINGKWENDAEAQKQLDKRIEAQTQNGKTSKPAVNTLSTTIRDLSKVCKLVAAKSAISEVDITAIEERMTAVSRLITLTRSTAKEATSSVNHK